MYRMSFPVLLIVASLQCCHLAAQESALSQTPHASADASTPSGKVATSAHPVIGGVNQAMQRFVAEHKIAGAVTLVARDGEVVHHGAVGLANIESDKPMKPFTLFSIASMTKPVTATAVMILQEEGKLNVQDKVSKYIPAFANLKLSDGSVPKREITIFDCLTHTSGLAGSQIFDGSLQEAVDSLATRPLAFEPGTQWKYSPGLNVAGRIIEIVSGQPLQDFMQDRIFDPLKMSNTTFFPDAKQMRRIATIYQPSEDSQSLVPAVNHIAAPGAVKGPNPSGGLVSSARDMFRFYQMVLNGGKFRNQRILSTESVHKMTSPQTGHLETGFTPGNCWGLGWCILRQPQDVTGMLSEGTFGHGGAFGTQGWVDPETKTIYVLMIQRTKMGNSDGSDVRKAFQQAANDAVQ
tara:strand:+ start:49490 stop:50710 length:1221 start_codon:yes stop_codon:yes gene_type:complete